MRDHNNNQFLVKIYSVFIIVRSTLYNDCISLFYETNILIAKEIWKD